jgi:hypothetical protein
VELAGGRAAGPKLAIDVSHLELASPVASNGRRNKSIAACELLQLPRTEETSVVKKAAVVTSFETLMERVRAKERRAEAPEDESTAKRQRQDGDDL